MKVEVAVLGSPSLISLMVSVDVKRYERRRRPGRRRPGIKRAEATSDEAAFRS